ncbi:uncharacterized protein ABDE67_005395 [Symphorus nematophorus]
MVRRRSVVWGFFKTVNKESVQCLLCTGYLVKHDQGTTTNMLRHLRAKHPEVVKKIKGRVPETTCSDGHQDMEIDGEQFCSVEVALEDGDSDIITTETDADLNSAINGILAAARGGPAEQIAHEAASNDPPARPERNKRSLVWRHYERLDSLDAARCRICMKKIQCSEGSSTSNLRRHMSKRHPDVFSQLVANRQNSPPSHTQASNVNGDTSKPPETVVATEKRPVSGALTASRVSEGEKRVFKRERELIEALRKAQREEARALEHQRELLEKLRAANTREAAADREQIESLRKAQQEEAKDLSRQKEELQKEKEELQKKWEELQQEREELLLFSSGQQAS